MFAIALLAGAWEWTHLAGWSAPFVRIAYVAVLGAMLASAAMLPPQAVFWIIALAALWWGYALMRIVAVQRGASMSARSPLAWWLTGWILLIPPWLALVELHRGGGRGAALVLMIMVLVWTADIGAYFAGRAFGKRKLALRVSPGKSWEGAIGGLVLAVAAGWGYGAYALGDAWFAFVALCAVTVVLSVIGDLTESLFKRESKVYSVLLGPSGSIPSML